MSVEDQIDAWRAEVELKTQVLFLGLNRVTGKDRPGGEPLSNELVAEVRSLLISLDAELFQGYMLLHKIWLRDFHPPSTTSPPPAPRTRMTADDIFGGLI